MRISPHNKAFIRFGVGSKTGERGFGQLRDHLPNPGWMGTTLLVCCSYHPAAHAQRFPQWLQAYPLLHRQRQIQLKVATGATCKPSRGDSWYNGTPRSPA